MKKVLMVDGIDSICETILRQRGFQPVVKNNIGAEELKCCIGQYEAIILRSATTLSKDIIETAVNLRAVARAGAGVDNIDVDACTRRNILVMNVPFGNIVSTAEYAVAMIMALARHIPQANVSTHAGKWEKKKFMGTEITGKTLGVIGCGNVGSIVVDRARGLKMEVLVYDPALTNGRAAGLGAELTSLDELYARSDFITYHVALSESTKGMLNSSSISRMKNGVRIVNCARGGIMVEEDVKAALVSRKIAALAVDVYLKEPAKEHIFFGMPNVIATPHIAASTEDAQVRVSQAAAEQISDYLLSGKKTCAVNGDRIK